LAYIAIHHRCGLMNYQPVRVSFYWVIDSDVSSDLPVRNLSDNPFFHLLNVRFNYYHQAYSEHYPEFSTYLAVSSLK